MVNFEDKSNNEILMFIKQLQLDHEALKNKMLKDYDKLVEIEELFDKANKLMINRLRGVKNE